MAPFLIFSIELLDFIKVSAFLFSTLKYLNCSIDAWFSWWRRYGDTFFTLHRISPGWNGTVPSAVPIIIRISTARFSRCVAVEPVDIRSWDRDGLRRLLDGEHQTEPPPARWRIDTEGRRSPGALETRSPERTETTREDPRRLETNRDDMTRYETEPGLIGLRTHFYIALNDTSLESRYLVTCVAKLLYFNFHQFLLKNHQYFGSDRRISDLIDLFHRDVTN